MDKKKIISFGVSVGPYQDFVKQVMDLGRDKVSSYVCVANVHMIIEAFRNDEFTKLINEADVVTPDGMPLVKSLRLLYGIQQDRVAGMDLMPSVINEAEKQDLLVYFYGSTDDVLDAIIKRTNKENPDLQIAGSYSPPFRQLNDSEEDKIVEQINGSGANIILVALGCPRQETWMAKNKGRINAVMLGVGGAFPVYAGMQKRAPKWMRNFSLEWFFRLSQEPGRLLWRYFYTNTLFILLMIRELIFSKKSSPHVTH